jgi:hypothetical protein
MGVKVIKISIAAIEIGLLVGIKTARHDLAVGVSFKGRCVLLHIEKLGDST